MGLYGNLICIMTSLGMSHDVIGPSKPCTLRHLDVIAQSIVMSLILVTDLHIREGWNKMVFLENDDHSVDQLNCLFEHLIIQVAIGRIGTVK